MNFHIQNLGPIADATLELGDLTLVVGRNNTGKTYITYALYGFLESWPGWPDADSTTQYAKLTERLAKHGRGTLKLDESDVNQERSQIARQLSTDFSREQLHTVFSVPSEVFADASMTWKVAPIRLSDLPSKSKFGDILSFSNDGTTLTVRVQDDDPPDLPRGWHRVMPPTPYLRFLFPELPDPFILSSERFGISLFYKDLDFKKSHLVDILQKMGDKKEEERLSPYIILGHGTSRYPLPIKDNIDFTRGISDLRGKSGFYTSRFFSDVKDMMKGYYVAAGDQIRFKSKARKKGTFDIPLHVASSSARGLSDLYFFLKSVATKNQLLMIDEPESHLDTHNQIMLARLLARAVNQGLKVMLSTHSDYMIKEFNNLIMLNQDFDEKEAFARKHKYASGEQLRQSSVRAYTATGDGLEECEIDGYGIRMPVFDETIDRINEISNELAARIGLSV